MSRNLDIQERLSEFHPHPRFADAVAAIDAGNVDELRRLVASDPALVHARTNLDPPYQYFTGATLLHHVAGNPNRAPLPANILEVARLLLETGADVNASTLGPNGGTTMGLVLTSRQASEANVSGPLIDLLLKYGAQLDFEKAGATVPEWSARCVLDLPLANHAPRAAEKLLELGAEADVCAAAALGRMDLLRDFFDEAGRLRSRPNHRRNVHSDGDAIGLALLFAYVNQRMDAVDFLLERDGNWNMTGVNNGTALHRAAWDGDLPMLERLVAKGADIANRENPYTATPLSWAQHNKQQHVVEWIRRHCRIDLHDAVGFGLRDHVEARLSEDPTAINRQIDQWDVPRATPLHWAVSPRYEDIDGPHDHNLVEREELVEFLLDRGADPNIVDGNGMTPLDVALAGGAQPIVALLQRRGAKRAAELMAT